MLPARFMTCALLALAVVADVRGQSSVPDLYGDPLPPGAVARFGTVRLRHDSPIVFAAFLPGGKSVLSVGGDGLVCVWEFPSGKELHRFEAHPADEAQAGSAPKSNNSAVTPNAVIGDILLAPTIAKVARASLSPDAKHLIAFCTDGFVRIWDWANAKQLGKAAIEPSDALRGAPAVAASIFAPDGKALILPSSARALQFVDIPSGKDIGPRQGHASPVTAIAFTPDGQQLHTSDGTSSRRRWDAATSKELEATAIRRSADLNTITYKNVKDISGVISKKAYNTPGTLVISPDGRFGLSVSRFATPTEANAAKGRPAVLFDATTGEKRADIAIDAIVAPTHTKPLVFSPNGALLAVSAGTDKEKIELYAVPSGKRLHTFETDLADPQGNAPAGVKVPAALLARTAVGQRMVFSADGKRLAFQPGRSAKVLVFDTTSGKQIGSLPAIKGSQGLQGAFSADGRCLVVEGADGTVTFIELATGQPRRSYGTKRQTPPAPPAEDPIGPQGIAGFAGGVFSSTLSVSAIPGTSLAISPDDKLLALAGPNGSIHIWDVLTGIEQTIIKGHTLSVNALAFAPDGKRLASAGDAGMAYIWDVAKIAPPPGQALQAGDLARAWQALTDNDGAKAFAAMADFAARPDDAVAWIKERVKPATSFDSKRVQELLKQLDDADYKARERATDDLFKLGDAVVPLLENALADNPPLEAKRRLDDLLGKMTNPRLQGEPLRVYRVVEILERIGTPEARAVLQALAGASR